MSCANVKQPKQHGQHVHDMTAANYAISLLAQTSADWDREVKFKSTYIYINIRKVPYMSKGVGLGDELSIGLRQNDGSEKQKWDIG